MIDIRPISDLRNKFSEIEASVNKGQPIFLTKNGYGTMVVLSIEQYSSLTNNIEHKLDEADRLAEISDIRLEHNEIFERVKNAVEQ